MRSGSSLLFLGCIVASANSLAGEAGASPKLVTIQGFVVDDGQAPVASAEVGLAQEGGKQTVVRSDNSGRFIFSNVPLVAGKLIVRRMGYRVRTITIDMFKVNAG